MKLEITEYKYEKVKVKGVEVNLPTEPLYLFETGIRRSIRIVPKFVTWDPSEYLKDKVGYRKGDVYEYIVTCVYNSWECKIEHFTIQVSDIVKLYSNDKSGPSEIVKIMILNTAELRNKERFDNDLKAVTEKINNII